MKLIYPLLNQAKILFKVITALISLSQEIQNIIHKPQLTKIQYFIYNLRNLYNSLQVTLPNCYI